MKLLPRHVICLGLFVATSIVCSVGYIFFSTRSTMTYRRESSLPDAGVQVIVSTTSSARLLFVGDMMFDRHIRKMIYTHGEDHIFSCIGPFLQEHDIVIGNLEGPITSNPSTSMGSRVGSPENYYFTFPTSTARLLSKYNIRLVSLGNNHIGNQKSVGISETKRYLDKEGVGYFGGLLGDEMVHQQTIQGIPFSFISYNQFGGDDSGVVSKKIANEKALGRVVIVYAHWGEEYQQVTSSIRKLAQVFAESGADMIIGSHPHIIQSHESIGSSTIYYSLGNFIFDQYFQKEVMEGLTLSVDISSDGKIRIKEYPVAIYKDGRTCLMPNAVSE